MFIMTKNGLEDVLEGHILAGATADTAQNNQMTGAQALYGALNYIGENAEDWVGMQDNAQQIDAVANKIAPMVEKKAISDTATNIRAVLKTFDENTLVGLAIGLSPDAEELKMYSQVLQAGDYAAMKGLLTKRDGEGKPVKDSLFNALYLPTARPDQLAQVVTARQRGLRDEFVDKYLSRNVKGKNKGDAPKREFSEKNAVDYVANTAKTVGDQAYIAIGGQYVENASKAARNSGSRE
jgi:hypothetical protein